MIFGEIAVKLTAWLLWAVGDQLNAATLASYRRAGRFTGLGYELERRRKGIGR